MDILIVDDDDETLDLLGRALRLDGHAVTAVPSASGARDAMGRARFDVLVLDVMLQESSGLDLCATLRRDGNDVPILFLSARGTVGARVEGLEAGGDDYLPKPFAMRELKARVHALGRRGRARRPVSFRSGPCTFDFDRRRAELAGVEVPVTAREWELLEVLIEAGGAVVPYQDLLESLWGEVSDETRASLDVIVSRLRSKLRKGANGESVVRTVRGRGYALRVDQ